jgi:hypothetical protein
VEQIVPARWYFAPEGAPLLPFPSVFWSNAWMRGEENFHGPGEVPFDRAWDKGVNYGYLAKCTLGDPEWFATGELPASVLTGPIPPLPVCCNPNPLVNCSACAGGRAPSVMRLRAVGGTGASAASNGEWILTQGGPGCAWSVATGPDSNWTVAGNSILWVATWSNPFSPLWNVYSFFNEGQWDCLGPTTLFSLSDQGIGGTAPTITVG